VSVWRGQSRSGEKSLEALTTFVKKIVEALEQSGLDYAITGALAASFYGIPRTTSDVDVIIVVAGKGVKSKIAFVLQAAELEFDEKKLDSAMKSGYRIATFKSAKKPYTVDIILQKQKLEKRKGKIDDINVNFQSPENLIAAKLRMIKATLSPERSAKDKDDIRAILEFTQVDFKAVKSKAKKDGTLQVLDSLYFKE
jgi:hypothetical protein